MSLPSARDSSETLVDPTPQISVDSFNSVTSSVPSPSTRFIYQLDTTTGDILVIEESTGEVKFTIKVSKEGSEEGNEICVLYEGKSKIAEMTEESLITKDGIDIRWSKFYKTSWFSRQSTWNGADEKRYSWGKPARHAKPNEIKLLDVSTKEIVASVQLATNGEPKSLTVSDSALPSLELIIVTYTHRMLKERIERRRQKRQAIEDDEEHDMMTW
ncbi:uncharacterized protein JCM6883_005845 [Sporobolomyces salmoneus]|uniref:uncharacterized protein n=1 Tax=Sporobolomyces salmoneus TaxID=183962 RepID=UPI0031719375